MLRYLLMPVPAGISLPMITFSFRPTSLSDRPLIAASVRTRVVSWKEAADSHESVASDAFVMPIRTGRPEAGSPPAARAVHRGGGQDPRGLGEGGRRQPRVRGQRRLRDAHQDRAAGGGLAAGGDDAAVLRLELR